jgi:hypothetical protein
MILLCILLLRHEHSFVFSAYTSGLSYTLASDRDCVFPCGTYSHIRFHPLYNRQHRLDANVFNLILIS